MHEFLCVYIIFSPIFMVLLFYVDLGDSYFYFFCWIVSLIR